MDWPHGLTCSGPTLSGASLRKAEIFASEGVNQTLSLKSHKQNIPFPIRAKFANIFELFVNLYSIQYFENQEKI